MIIDGKAVAQQVRDEVRVAAQRLRNGHGVVPGLGVVLVGDDPASRVYVRNKEKACAEVGIRSVEHLLPASVSEHELLDLIARLNEDPAIHGILVQLPLPEQIASARILEAVSPAKDVDGFHPVNQGLLLSGGEGFRPCTPLGIMRMLDSVGCPLKGRNAVVVGRSNIVGKPVALMLLERHATVTLCHSRTADLAGEVGRADVVVAAVGKTHAIRGEWIKPGAVVIDVGINRLPDGKLAGDVEFDAARERASWISPVPGGVGPMTICMLLSNTLLSAQRSVA
ncbi:MAG: bifunctional methylenetetrahydrofolate dehydrogenase/methenyltetrahydrofolate cyclohydrolase FolD [Deltaproteobacteria bacterium]|nr:bifunctional methylenetetrahydrofolate dehydrogenase/methenyltetrahydrofolate cyclohydrolase FolD [Deltaproteobacteria bacterium]